jgi:hypothetical protein
VNLTTKVLVTVPAILGVGTVEHNPATHWHRNKDGALVVFYGEEEVAYYKPATWLRVNKQWLNGSGS